MEQHQNQLTKTITIVINSQRDLDFPAVTQQSTS